MAVQNKYKKKAKRLLKKFFLSIKSYKMEDAIIIFSEARGGSTWLMELLNRIPGTVINWEPLHVTNGVVPTEYNLGWRPLLPVDTSEPRFKSLFKSLLTLRKYNDWTFRYIDMVDLKNSKHVLTKFVRGNNVMPYIVTQFPEMKHTPIFLLRHPITTCISRIRTFQKKPVFSNVKSEHDFQVPDCINNERFQQHLDYINSLDTVLEVEVALWCVNNAHLIDHELNHKWQTVYYEDIVLDPETELNRILSVLGLSIPDETMRQIDFKKASATNYRRGLKDKKKEQLEGFLKTIGEAELQNIQAVFDNFNFTTYSAFNAYPNTTS